MQDLYHQPYGRGLGLRGLRFRDLVFKGMPDMGGVRADGFKA